MLKKFFKTTSLFLFVFIFMFALNTSYHPFRLVAESFSFSKDWFPFQELSKLERLNKVLYLIQESYVDPERVNFSTMFASATDLLSGNIVKLSVNHGEKKTILNIAGKKKEFPTKIDTMFGLRSNLVDTINFLSENVDREFTITQLEEFTIEGVLDTLDPHSTFLPEQLYKEMQVGTSGKFGGLGIVIGIRESALTVISPIDDTPASKAGILPGDHIIKIEQESTVGMPLTEAVELMRGPKGEPITITIERKSLAVPKEFHLVRDIIRVESVEAAILPNDIGYIKLKSFQEDTTKQLKKALGQLNDNTAAGMKGLVLDLRNNPGGLLDQAINVSDIFLEEGTIVTTVGLKNKMRDSQVAELKNTQALYPIVILVNEGSASASEIVAGALQRNMRAVVLGQKTFGKGTVQTLYELPQKSALKLTVAKYLTPGDISIQSIGIGPDIQTVPVVVDKEQMTFFYSEDEHGEAELERHFTNDQKTISMDPALSVEYLFQKPKDDQDTAKEYSFSKLSKEQKQKKLLEDFETRSAYDILVQTVGNGKKQLIDAAQKTLTVSSKLQSDQIAAAMQKQGIDWSLPVSKIQDPASCKEPEVTFQVISANASQQILAGDKIEIEAKMKNIGSCTLYQAQATSKSDSGFFDHREIFFGKIDPQQTVARKIPLTIPQYQPAGTYELSFKFGENQKITPQPKSLMVSVLPNKKPMFSFDYEINDQVENQSGFLAPHVPERGEKFYLTLNVKNIGEVPSKEAFVSIRQEGDKTLVLQKVRETFTQFAPKQQHQVKFLIEVPQQLNEPFFEINIGVSDADYQSFIQKKLKVYLYQAKVAEKREVPSSKHFEEPMISVFNLGNLMKRQQSSATIEGQVKDDMNVQDMYVIVNGTKTTYHSFQDKNKTQNFSLKVPLKAGKNEVIVVARDNQDLIQTFPLNIISQ